MKKLSDILYKKMIKALQKVLDGGSIPMPKGDTPPETDEKANLNVVLWGDPQISCLSPLRAARVTAACRDISAAKGKYDALVMLGDITEYGAKCEYKMAAHLINGIADKVGAVFAVSGNHDIRLRFYRAQQRRFNAFLGSLQGGRCMPGKHYYFADEVNGYRFLMLGADRTKFEASFLSKAQLAWIDRELSAVPRDKPVFIFNHQPLKYANGLPLTWMGFGKWRGSVGLQSNQLREILEKHRNVVYITGHLHYGISRYAYQDYGSFHAVSVPTVGVLNHGENDKLSQGMLMRVYDDRIVFQGRVHSEGCDTDSSIVNAHFEIPLKTD